MTRLIHALPLLTFAATVSLFGVDAVGQEARRQETDAQETGLALHIENIGSAPGQFKRGQFERDRVDKAPDQQHSRSYERPPSREEQVAAAIQRRAEIRSQQRSLRLAAQKWYGVSNARPTVTLASAWSPYRPAQSQRQFQRFAWYRIPSLPAAPIAPSAIRR